MDLLGAQIFDELELSKKPLSVDYLCRKCKKPEKQIEESLENLKAIGLVSSDHQGYWVLYSDNIYTADDLSLDAEQFDSLPRHTDPPRQNETLPKVPTEAETELKVLNQASNSPIDSSSCHTIPKVPSNSASNAECSPSHSPLRGVYNVSQTSDTTKPKVPSRERSEANCSSTPVIEEVTLSGSEEEDLSRKLEATSLKEPVNQSTADGVVVPCKSRQPARQNSDQTTSMVVGGCQIETSGSVKSWQLSRVDPAIKQPKDIIVSIIQHFQSTHSNGEKTLDVAKKCIGKNASKKDINRYLHSLNKVGVLQVEYQNKQKNSDPRWRATQKIHDISDEKIEEISAELSTSKNSRSDQIARLPSNGEQTGNSSPCSPGCLHLHQHHHHHRHEHHTVVQVGEGNKMRAHVNVSDIES
ncbi:uncharacterized protein LOC133205103 [Saccostrea echinata]|uniref:uncharacterized protein LOC133205103 n=1 Tax=Saccostrea echinata TaxID=191078 RepID=UPI002A815803|nr:uncharacterized protein LOC133205103 [Saccostrea echinata]